MIGMGRVAVIGFIGLAAACSDHKNPKANLACGETGCLTPPPKGNGGATSTDGGLKDGTVSDAPGGVTVTGTVSLFQSDDFATVVPFGDPATVRLDGATGVDVEGNYDGTTFTVSGVLSSASIWSTVIPTNIAAAMPTIEPFDATTPVDVELHVIPASTIDLIYGFLTIPEARADGAAHVVLRFVDDVKLEPVVGVTVTHAGEAVAYDASGTWTDTAPGTGTAGYAVVVNVATTKLPVKQTFQYSSALATGGVEIRVAPDTVTIAQVRLGQ